MCNFFIVIRWYIDIYILYVFDIYFSKNQKKNYFKIKKKYIFLFIAVFRNVDNQVMSIILHRTHRTHHEHIQKIMQT